MPRVLFIAHAPSDNTRTLRDAVVERITAESEDTTLTTLAPPDANAQSVFDHDAVLIATTENIGYMAGLTKDFFDRSYNDMLDATEGKPVAIYIRAGLDGTGTKRALEAICTGLKWKPIAPPLVLKGKWQDGFAGEAAELGLTLAAGMEMGIY